MLIRRHHSTEVKPVPEVKKENPKATPKPEPAPEPKPVAEPKPAKPVVEEEKKKPADKKG
jgi:protein TonB